MKKIAFLLALFALPLHADLRSQITAQNGWVAYAVPIAGDHRLVCSWGDSWSINDGHGSLASSELHVQYEVTERRITSVRLSSPECPERKAAVFLGRVDPRESVRLLVDLVETNTDVGKKAVTAIALHEGTEEDLIRIAKNHRTSKMRSSALFWIGQAAGKKAASVLRDAVDNDPDAEVKTKAVFAISQMPNDKSIPMLVELMNTHRAREVRKKAAFWLGQKNDPRALAALEAVLLK
jgi:HEAT repeat protein